MDTHSNLCQYLSQHSHRESNVVSTPDHTGHHDTQELIYDATNDPQSLAQGSPDTQVLLAKLETVLHT